MAADAAGRAGSPASAAALIVRDVVRGLYDGRFAPGQRLIEAQIGARLGASRGPVREALNTLAAMGVVDLTRDRGAQVRLLSPRDASDILIVAQALIGVSARLAADRIDQPDARPRLEAALAAIERFDPDDARDDYAVARDGFYATLTRIAGNGELRRILPSVQIHLIRVQYRDALRPGGQSRHADYRRIAAAVLAGRAAEAERAARRHLGRAIDQLTHVGGQASD